MLLDTGTTQMLLPGSEGVTAIQGMQQGDMLVITLQDPKNSRRVVRLSYTEAALQLPSGDSAVDVLGAGTASVFSSDQDVGILGCALQRGLYIEYNITAKLFGFGVPAEPLHGV